MTIVQAGWEDLPEILKLQYLAYRSEALLLHDDNIPPLRQTLEEVQNEFLRGIILKALDESGNIVGSVRGRAENGTLYIGKLFVRPDCQGRGIGAKLLSEIERSMPQRRCELFTSAGSEKNLRFYERAGYRAFKTQEVKPGLTFAFLEKLSGAAGAMPPNG